MGFPTGLIEAALQHDMSYKRRNSSSPECETPAKRQRQQPARTVSSYDGVHDYDFDDSETEEQPQVHAFTGQTSAFPGLGQDEDDLFYGPAVDGLDYLRMVRSEAKGIPDLLIAEPAENDRVEEEIEEEDGGYWEDDAYIALPRDIPTDTGTDLPEAQSRYYEVLLAHYDLIRATVKCVPPLSAIEKLTSSQPISFPAESKKARYTWAQCLRTRNPSPTQIACMDENSVFELVRLMIQKMRGLFEKDDVEVARRLGAWIWAMLGKCPERGEMGSEEISMLRDLARKAIEVRDWLTRKNRRIEVSWEGEDESGEDDEEEDGQQVMDANGESVIDSEIRAARLRLTTVTKSQSIYDDILKDERGTALEKYIEGQKAKQEKLVTLDMILTVVSEAYGQRDLQEYRTVWEQDPT